MKASPLSEQIGGLATCGGAKPAERVLILSDLMKDYSWTLTDMRPIMWLTCSTQILSLQWFEIYFFITSHSGREQPHVGPQLPLQAGGV